MLKKILLGLVAFLVLLAVLVAGALFYVNTESGKAHLSRIASDKLRRDVVLSGGIGLRADWPPTFYVHGLRIANSEGGRAENMAKIGEAELSLAVLPLFRGELEFPRIAVADSRLNLERGKEGPANWEFGDKKETGTEPSAMPRIGALDIRDTRVTYLDVPKRIDIAVDAHTEGQDIVVSGDGTYLGKTFGLKTQAGSLLTVQSEAAYPIDSTLTVGETTIHAKGTLRDPTHLGGMDIALRVKGADAAELFPLLGIALPPTPPYDLRGQLTYGDKAWRFSGMKGRLGDSDLSGEATWDQAGERPKLTARLVSQKLDFKDLGPLIGLAPEEPVSAEQKQKAAEQEASPYVIPDVPLDISRLAAMDADVEFTGKQVISPSLPLDDFYMKLGLEDRLLTIAPIKFGTAGGDIAAHLKVNGRQAQPETDADFQFSRLSLARLMEGVGEKLGDKQVAEGFIGGRAKLHGRGKSLRDILASADGNVGVGMEGGKLSNLLIELVGLDVAQALGFFLAGDELIPINCIIGDFEVKGGLMQSRHLVIDTADTNVQAGGTINLKGEALDLRLVPKPKDATLVSLRSPIEVEGTMKQPDINIEKTNLAARGGAAVALSVALTPVAAVLAFIEPGLGEDSNCARLVREMGRNTGSSDDEVAPKND